MAGPFRYKRGAFAVVLSDVEAAAIRRVAEEMLQALESDHLDEPQMRRLFPPAYENDAKLQDEFLRMTHDDLVARKRNAARTVISSIDAGKFKRGAFTTDLDDETMQTWLGFINDARLVLGAKLGVTEDMDHEPLPAEDPRAAAHNMYVYLSGIEWQLVDALSEAAGLGPADTGIA